MGFPKLPFNFKRQIPGGDPADLPLLNLSTEVCVSYNTTNCKSNNPLMKKNLLITCISAFVFTASSYAQASFSMDTSQGCAPLCINFSDLATGATAWQWNFGDATTSTIQNPSHCYSNPGTYVVTLIETFASGNDTATGLVNVYANPVASFTYSVSGNTVTFTDQSTNAAVWYWYFGDAGTSTMQNPTHTYATAGTYTVYLLVESALGCTDTAGMSVIAATTNELSAPGENWNFYPNPSQGIVTIHFDQPLKEAVPVRVENTLGEVIFSGESAGDLSIDLSGEAAGIYFIRIGNGPAKKVLVE